MKPKCKLVETLRGELMALIKNIETIFGRGQDNASTQPQIRKNQIVVGDDYVSLFQSFACTKKTALGNMGAAPARTLALICGDQPANAR